MSLSVRTDRAAYCNAPWGEEMGIHDRQLGTIGDVLRILIKHIRPEDLEPEERRAVTALQDQLDEIDRMKARREHELTRPGSALANQGRMFR